MYLEEETLNKLRLNSPPGGWFPALQELYWYPNESNLPYADVFFSSHLKRISIHMIWPWKSTGLPSCIRSTLASTISALPTSSLQHLSFIGIGHPAMSWEYLTDPVSSVILRCGPSFTEYNSPVPLSDAALNHLIHLPHLRTWRTHSPPPSYPASSLPPVFPPLRKFTLGEGAARGWLPLLECLEDGIPTTESTTSLSKVKESLKFLHIEDPPGATIDAFFVSPIRKFRNLVDLDIDIRCYDEGHERRCAFKLNNDNVAELTIALPQLESLLLGRACSENTCLTTVACLLQISVHCVKLEKFKGVHLNTTNIVEDFKNIHEDPRFKQLLSLPRCPLKLLGVYQTPLTLDEPGFETVAKGMINIFPSLRRCDGLESSWDKVSWRLVELQKLRTLLACYDE